MSRYFVRVYATLAKDYVTEAESYEEAVAKAKEAYSKGLIAFRMEDLVEGSEEFIGDAFEDVLKLKLIDQTVYEELPVVSQAGKETYEYFCVR